MPLVQVVVGNKVAAPDVNQVIQALTGVAAHPFLLSGSYDTSDYPINIWNTGAGGKMLFCRLNSGTFLDVTDVGVRLSPDGTLFNRIPVVTTGAQTISGKSIDGATNTFSNILQSTLGKPEGAIARRDSSVNITNDNASIITWNSESYDSGGFYAGSSDNKITCQRSGIYDVYVGIFLTSVLYEELQIFVRVNGAATQPLYRDADIPASAYGDNGICLTTVLVLGANDSVQVEVRQKSGATRNLTSSSYFGILRRGPTS